MKPFMSALPRPYRRPSLSSAPSGSNDQSCPSHGTVSVWPETITPAGLPSPTVAKRFALPRSSSKVSLLCTPCRASSSRMKWISSRFDARLTVFMRTRLRASSRARAEGAAGMSIDAI